MTEQIPCPHCGAMIATVAKMCSHCFTSIEVAHKEADSVPQSSLVSIRIRRIAQSAGAALPIICEIDEGKTVVVLEAEYVPQGLLG